MRPTRVRMPAGMRGVQPMNVMGGRPQGPVPQMQQMQRPPQQMKVPVAQLFVLGL